MTFLPPPELIVHETPHWRINRRVSCVLPGYLMVGARNSKAVELSDVGAEGLGEIGQLLGRATAILRGSLGAEKVYIARYGHDSGHTFHFHVIPIYQWLLAAFQASPAYFVAEQKSNGAELTRFIWREYCEKSTTSNCPGHSIGEAIEIIRNGFNK